VSPREQTLNLQCQWLEKMESNSTHVNTLEDIVNDMPAQIPVLTGRSLRAEFEWRKHLLVDFTAYKSIALWWFVDSAFEDFLRELLSQKSHDEYAVYPVYPVRGGIRKKSRVWILTLRSIIARIVIGAIVQLCQINRSSKNLSRLPKVIFNAQDVEWRVYRDPESGALLKSDQFFHTILKRFVGRAEAIGVYPITKSRIFNVQIASLKIFFEKSRTWYVRQRPFELYWSLDAARAEADASEHFEGVWLSLKRSGKLVELFPNCEERIRRHIERKLEYYLRAVFPFAVRLIQMARRMIEEERPGLILLQNEYGFFERALLVAGKQHQVPTLAIQHGAIDSEHGAYMHPRSEISPDGSAQSPYCPLPDKTAVYGPLHKHILTKLSAYPEDSVVVTGQPRYDRLRHMKRLYSRKRLCKRYNIDMRDMIMLWTTQCHGLSAEENRRNFECVLKVVSRLKNVTLIIKQHPGEGANYTTMIKGYLAEYRANAVVTPGDSDTYEQLYACDLLISKTSTTILEAVALGKPVIVLDLSGVVRPIGLDYVKEGVALGVSSGKELGPAIETLLSGGTQLLRNRKRFVRRYLYKLDGKATDRVVNLIEGMMRHARSKRQLDSREA